ncbi:MAG: DUF2079 domain-containing protein [Candidatus Bathyarchaeota archaeon]|jgi:uncharacterized membrane protein|nr:DUF2079 domain-containing protein [Candidatus Bathyarchaeota archaeon]
MKLIDSALYLQKRFGYKVYIFIAIFIYTIVFSVVEIMIYQSFRIFTWDLGIFNQAFWNTLHGKFLYYTSEIEVYTKTGCFLAAHFSPTILLALPLYAIYPTGENLLVIGTLLVAVGALPIYKIANYFLKDEKVAVTIGILYLLHPSLQGITLSGFSPESFAVTLFAFILYYLIKVDLKKLALAVTLGLMTHEAAAPVIAAIGVYGMLQHKSFKNRGFQASLIVLVISIPYFFFANYMRLFFGWTGRPSLWHEWVMIGATNASELPLKILLNPVGALNSLASDGAAKLLYITLLLLPVLFIPLLGLKGLIPAVPYLSMSLFSTYRLYYSLEGHYGAFIAPFIFLGFVHGLTKLQEMEWVKFSALKFTTFAFLTTTIVFATMLPTAYSQYQVFNPNDEHNSIVRSFISRIPQNASVLTQSNIFPHLSNRPDAYTIAPPTWSYEYMQVDKEILANLSKQSIQYVLLDFASEPPYSYAASFIYTKFVFPNIDKYGLIDAKDGVVLFCLNEHT